MKNAKTYEKKVKKLLAGLSKLKAEPIPLAPQPVRAMVLGVLEADAPTADAQRALEALENEFVDYNELRVAPAKDVVECIGRDYPCAWNKAYAITGALHRIFGRASQVQLDYAAEMGKRDLRRHLVEIGLDPYASAYTLMVCFGGHAIPVDQALVDCLEMQEYIHPGSDVSDVQGFLERIIAQKYGLAAHQFLRQYLAQNAQELAEYQAQKAVDQPPPAQGPANGMPPEHDVDAHQQLDEQQSDSPEPDDAQGVEFEGGDDDDDDLPTPPKRQAGRSSRSRAKGRKSAGSAENEEEDEPDAAKSVGTKPKAKASSAGSVKSAPKSKPASPPAKSAPPAGKKPTPKAKSKKKKS